MKKILILCLLCMPGGTTKLQAQTTKDFEKLKSKYEHEYLDFKQQAEKDYEDFRDKANAEYAQFMREAWEWYKGERPMPMPVISEPIIPPVTIPEKDKDKIPENRPIEMDEIIPVPKPKPVPEPVAPVPVPPRPAEEWYTFTFYGTSCRVRLGNSQKIFLDNTKEKTVAKVWEKLAGKDYNALVHDCLELRNNMQLCDWAYVQMIDTLFSKYYRGSFPSEVALFQTFVLSQSGYKVHIARGNDDLLHMLIASDYIIYNYSYWNLNREKYYLLEHNDVGGLFVYTKAFPEECCMRLAITQEQRFKETSGPARTLASKRYPEVSAKITTNKNLIDFFNNYPVSYINNDATTKWRFYANAPLSYSSKSRLYPILKQVIAGKSEKDAANRLINFVQTAFVYEYDDKVWGGDRAFFAEETLYYPYSDCEDRAILFSRLVRDLMGLDVVLVYYPGHLATAVQFHESISGDYLIIGEKRYLVCDPTYIGASIGLTMPGMDNQKAKVVILN